MSKFSNKRVLDICDRLRGVELCGFNTLEHRNVARLQTCVRQVMITMHPYTLENNTDGPWISDLSELCDVLLLGEEEDNSND